AAAGVGWRARGRGGGAAGGPAGGAAGRAAGGADGRGGGPAAPDRPRARGGGPCGGAASSRRCRRLEATGEPAVRARTGLSRRARSQAGGGALAREREGSTRAGGTTVHATSAGR